MRVLYATTLVWGAIGTGAALAMMEVKSALDAWWQMAGIFSGGMLGLFLLGLIARRARNPAAIAGVLVGVLAIVWMTFSPDWGQLSGTVSVAADGRTVHGADARFDVQLQQGDSIIIDGSRGQVDAVAGPNRLTLVAPLDIEQTTNQVAYNASDPSYRLRSPLNSFLVTVVGTLAILIVGIVVSRFTSSSAVE